MGSAACATLEKRGYRCWIAPRDILPGKEWGEAIIEGIVGARIFVLIFSANANASPQVRREIERAVHHGTILVPFRIENVLPAKSLEYFLSAPHWLDALTPPLEQHLEHLSEVVGSLLGAKDADAELGNRKSLAHRAPSLSPAISLPAASALMVAIVPLFAMLGGVDPPWPAGSGYMSILLVIAGILGGRQLLAQRSEKDRSRQTATTSTAAAGLVLYLVLYSLFVETIPHSDVRVTKGFVCTADALLVYGKTCPSLPRDALRDAEWETMALWTGWSVTIIRIALVMTWSAFIGGLSLSAISFSPPEAHRLEA